MSSITNHSLFTRTIPSHILVSQPANPTHILNPSAYSYSLTSTPPCHPASSTTFFPHIISLPYLTRLTPQLVLLLHPPLSPCASPSFFILLHTLGAYLLTPSPSPSHFIPLHTSPFLPLLPSSLPYLFTPSPLNPHLYPFPPPTGSQMSWTEHQWSGRW